jgi:hypothetical protein
MKARRFIILLSTAASCFLLLSSQGYDEDQQAIIDEGVEIKIKEFILRQEKKCWDRAVGEAVIRVDSMVRAGAIESRLDPVAKPDRPNKPTMPPLKQLPDSLNHGILRND